MARYMRVVLATTLWLTVMNVAHSATVELAENAQIIGERIELGAVATVGGSDEDVARLVSLDLGPAPLPGQSRLLSLGYLKMRLRRWGIRSSEIVFAGARQVRVSKAAVISTVASADTEAPAQPGVMLPPPVIVKRGSMVRLRVTCGAVSVVAGATTLEDAEVGAIVKMRVAQTRQTVWAVLASQTEANLNQ